MTHLSLFTGIGGLDPDLEGIRREVLRGGQHEDWPD